MLLGVLTVFALGCKSKIDRALELITPYEKYFMGSKVVLDSIPMGLESKLSAFSKEFKQYSKSPQYLFAAAYIAEKRGKIREAADFSAMYVDEYPNEKKHRMESAMVAAHYFENMQKFDLALKYYDILTKEFSTHEIGKQAKFTAEMIRKGAVTPEQQLQMMLERASKDSVGK